MSFWKALGQATLCTVGTIGTAAIEGTVGAAKTAFKVYDEYQKPEKDRRIFDCVASGLIDTTCSTLGKSADFAVDGISAIVKDYQADAAHEESLRQQHIKTENEIRDIQAKAVNNHVPYSRRYNFKVGVAGANKEERYLNISDSDAGKTLTAVREKDNNNDKNAIALYKDNHKIGYIPKDTAAKITPKIDSGKSMFVTVDRVVNGGTPAVVITATIIMESDYAPKKQSKTTYSHSSYNDDDYYDYDEGYSASNSSRYRYKNPEDWDDEDYFWEDVYEHEHD